MGAFDISYNDIAGAPLGSGKKKVAPIQAAQGIAAPTAALSSPQLIDARQSITQAPTVQQLVPAQSITQGAESYMRAHQPGDAVAISYPPIMPDATTSPRPVPVMPTPPGIAKSMSGGAGQQPAPATIADIRQPNNQAQPMRNQPVMNPVEPHAATPAPAQTVDDGAGGVYTPGGGAIGPDKQGSGIVSGIANFFRDSAQAARTGVHYDDVKANRVAAENAQPANAAQPQSAPAPGAEFKQDQFGPKPDPMAIQPTTDGQFMTGKNGAAPDSSSGGFTTKEGVSYNVNPTDQEGIAKVTATGKNPLFTNIRPEDAVTGLKNQSVGGNPQEGLDRMARANATWQEVIDKQPVGGVGIMGDGGIDAANDEKTARWRQDDLLAKARFNPAAGQVALESARGENMIEAEQIRSGSHAAAESGRNAVAMRGQNINAQNEANRLAIDAPYRTEQAAGLREQNRSAAVIADLQNKALAGNAGAIETLRALNGKSESNFMPVTKKVYNELGQVVGEDVGAFDKRTGQAVGVGGQKSAAGAPAAGEVRGGYKFKGGNPADKNSWEKV